MQCTAVSEIALDIANPPNMSIRHLLFEVQT